MSRARKRISRKVKEVTFTVQELGTFSIPEQKLHPNKHFEQVATHKSDDDDDDSQSDKEEDEEESFDDLSFFALYKATPGRLVIDSNTASFFVAPGFNHISQKLQSVFTEYTPSLKDMAAIQHAEQWEGKTRLAARIILADVECRFSAS